jgi:ribosomal protein S27AE
MIEDTSLSSTQRTFRRRASPELFAAMQRESRLWQAECPNCQADVASVWDMGGIRYRAAGEPRRKAKCPRCGQTGWLRIHWTGGDPDALGPRPSVTPMVLRMVLMVLIPLLLIGVLAGLLVFFLT